MLFVGLIVLLLLHPLLINTPLAIIDIVVVFVMGLTTFVPLTLFVRGINNSQSASEG
jgi:hypothetical protein